MASKTLKVLKAHHAPRRSLRSTAQAAPAAEPEERMREASVASSSDSFDAKSMVPAEPPLRLPESIPLFSRTIKLASSSKHGGRQDAVFVPTAYETLRKGLVDWFPEHDSLRQLEPISTLIYRNDLAVRRQEPASAPKAGPPSEPGASASSSQRKRPRKVKIELKARLRPSARVGAHCDLLCGSPAGDRNVGAFELHAIAPDEVCSSLLERGRFEVGQSIETVERPTLLLGHVVPGFARSDGTVASMAPELFQQEWLGFEKHSVRVTLEAPFLVPDILIGPAALHPVGRSVRHTNAENPLVRRRDPVSGHQYTSDLRARVPPGKIVGQLSFSVQLQDAAFEYGRLPGADPYPRSTLTSTRQRALPRLLGPFLDRVLADPTGGLKYDLYVPDFWSSGGGHYAQWTRDDCQNPEWLSALMDIDAGSASTKLPLSNSIDVLLEGCRPPSDAPAVYPPQHLVPTPLKLYQAQAVAWMIRREKRGYHDVPMLYPQWTAMCARNAPDAPAVVKAEPAARLKKRSKRDSTASEAPSKSMGPSRARVTFYVDEVTGMPSLRPFRGLVQDRGGALCDGLGLGKSLETLSLITMRPKGNGLDPSRSATIAADLPADYRPLPVRATLIVTPAALLEQWHAETAKHTPSLRVIRWQSSTVPWEAGELRKDTRAATHEFFEDDDYDVVLTSYEHLRAELTRSKRVMKSQSAQSPLLEVLWHRVVLDEAQLIAGSSGSAAEFCSCLWRTSSWVVTSTPCASIGELSGIFSFLDLDPFADPRAFDTLVADGFRAGDAESIRRASGLCRNIIWRNSRVHVADQLGLPPSSEVTLTTKMAGLQRTIYEREAQLVKEQIEDAVKRNLKNVKHILGPFQQLRQLLDHPQLAERLGYGSSDARRSFEDLTTNLMRRLTRELKVKRLERATLVLAIVAGQRAFEAEKRPSLWRGGVPVWTEEDINVQCRAALAACKTALEDEEQVGLDEQDVDESAAVPELPRPKGTRRLTLEEAIYWLRHALGEKRLALPQHYEPERMTMVFFQRDFVLQKKVDMKDPRYHPISVDAGGEDELKDDGDDGDDGDDDGEISDSQARKKKKGRSEFEAPTLKANKLRGVEKRKRARAWHWVPRHKLETLVNRLQAAKVRADQLSHERAYLQSCIDEERQRNGGDNDEGTECMICLCKPDIRALLPCLHGGCYDCLLDLIRTRNKKLGGTSAPCPICREPYTAKRIIQVLPKEDVLDAATAEYGCKIAVLVKDIQARLVADPDTKCVVFSVFKRMLRLVSEALKDCGIASMAFAGTEEAKSNALVRFREDGQVLTVPLAQAQGAAGLTLTMANVSYFLEPVLDPSLESQAKGRLLRIGQTRPVTLVRILIEGTIEPAIAEMASARQQQMEHDEGNEDAAAAVTRGEKNDVSLAELVDVFSVASLDALEQAAAADRVARGQRLDDELLAFEAGQESESDSDDGMY